MWRQPLAALVVEDLVVNALLGIDARLGCGSWWWYGTLVLLGIASLALSGMAIASALLEQAWGLRQQWLRTFGRRQ